MSPRPCSSVEQDRLAGEVGVSQPQRLRIVARRDRVGFLLPPFVETPAFRQASHQQQEDALVEQGLGIIRLERDRPVIARERRLAAMQRTQGVAAIVVGFRVVGPDGDRQFVARRCLLSAPQVIERIAAVVVGLGIFRREADRLVVARDRRPVWRPSALSALPRLLCASG